MRGLFDGAIICELPDSYEDVSYFREIPDNEEVLQESATDSSVIIELLEFQDDVKDGEIAKFHFANIAEMNQVQSYTIEHMVKLDCPQQAFGHFMVCTGVQTGIVKFREQDPVGNDISVSVAVARMKQLNLEIVISLSAPITISQTSSSHTLGSVPNAARGKQVFETLVSSFQVKDYGLFA